VIVDGGEQVAGNDKWVSGSTNSMLMTFTSLALQLLHVVTCAVALFKCDTKLIIKRQIVKKKEGLRFF
jgi:hypothetical protein